MLTTPRTTSKKRPSLFWREFYISLALYVSFASAVFLIMGQRPMLGSDHLSYMRLAEEIAEKHPGGNYIQEIDSVRSFSVMLAYLQHFTGSHVLSMKLILAAESLPYLFAAELLLSLFTTGCWKRRIFALMSGFAVSLGVASWGITDYTALMPRTLVMPAIFFCFWFFLRFYQRAWRYAVFPVLVLFSTVHLSTFYCIGVLLVFEVFDIFILRRRIIDIRVVAFPSWLFSALVLLLALQSTGLVVDGTGFLRSMILPNAKNATASVSKTDSERRTGRLKFNGRPYKEVVDKVVSEKIMPSSTPREAWQFELTSRAWRNMPLPWINVANIFSSFGLIMLLACTGAGIAFSGVPRELDRKMAWMVPAIVFFALGPQTALWILRKFTEITPVNIEEIRALSFLMIPALYFCVRLFDWLGDQSGLTNFWGRTGVVIAYLALPLTMKSLTPEVRNRILDTVVRVGLVNSNPAAINNARSALGLSYRVPLYYPVEGISRWLRDNGQFNSLVLTDRDDMLVRNLHFVGSRQEVALQDSQTDQASAVLFIHTRLKRTLSTQNLSEAMILAKEIEARYLIVPWPVEKAVYRDDYFSLIDLHQPEIVENSK